MHSFKKNVYKRERDLIWRFKYKLIYLFNCDAKLTLKLPPEAAAWPDENATLQTLFGLCA